MRFLKERQMSENRISPRILGFLCNWCCYTAADSAGVGRYQYPTNLRVIRLMCTGRLDPSFPLEAFATGADAVFVGGCHPGECHYQDGNYHAIATASFVHEALERIGIKKERFLLEWASAAEGPRFVQVITEFTKTVTELGPVGMESGLDPASVREKVRSVLAASKEKKIRLGLVNASREMMKQRDFSRQTIAGLVNEKVGKHLNALTGGSA